MIFTRSARYVFATTTESDAWRHACCVCMGDMDILIFSSSVISVSLNTCLLGTRINSNGHSALTAWRETKIAKVQIA